MSSLEIRVRLAVAADVRGLAELHVRTWLATYRGQMSDAVIAAQTVERREQMWRSIIERQQHGPEVATLGDVVLGFCDLTPSRDAGAPREVGEITSIYVDPAHWGTGVGRALLESGVERAQRFAYATLTLWVLETNAAARRFYERLGFLPDGETKPVYGLQEVRYRRPLDGARRAERKAYAGQE